MLKIECRETGDALVVEFVGRMDGGPATIAVKIAIASQLEIGHRRFVFNIAELGWMNSTGISVLVEISTSIKNAGGSVVLMSPTNRVHTILEMNGLITTVFKIVDDEADAVKYFQSRDDV